MSAKTRFSPPGGPEPDGIRIEGLRLRAVLGAFPEERAAPREVVAHFALETDVAAAAASDDLADAVDWGALCARLRAVAAARPWRLAETLAAALADAALEDPGVRRVRVRLDKPAALPGVGRFSVVLDRTR